MKLYYTDDALEDIELAFDWYEEQSHGLGQVFIDCLEQGVQNIIEFPDTFPITHRQYRRKLIKKFPFSIFYTIEINEIIVHAVFDNRQHPKKITK